MSNPSKRKIFWILFFLTLSLGASDLLAEEKGDAALNEPDAIELAEEQIALDDEAFLFEDFDDLEDWEFEKGLGFEQFTEEELFVNENLVSDQALGDFADLEYELDENLPALRELTQ